jgi:drug/metabolite transporter (DMT)-like permease
MNRLIVNRYKLFVITLGILTMLSSYFLYVTLNHTSDISNFIAVGIVGFVLMVLGIVLELEKLQKLSSKIFTIHVFAALVTIVIANVLGWVNIGEIIEDIRRFTG